MNYIKTNNKEVKESNFQTFAVFSIAVYIVITAIFETSTTLNSGYSSYAIYFCLGVCAFNLIRKNVIRVNLYSAVLIMLMGVFALSSYFSPASELYKDMYLYRFITSAILVILVLNTISSFKEINVILNSVVVAGTALAIVMYAQYGFSNLADAVERLDNAMGNQNQIGLYCAFGIIFAFYLLLSNLHTWRVFYYIGCIIISTPAVMFTASRKAIIVIAAALLVLFVFYFNSKNVIKKLFAFLFVLLIIYFIIDRVPAFSVIRERFVQMFELFAGKDTDNIGDENRVNFLNVSMEYFFKAPVFGNGFCYSYHLFGTYTHNNFTELLLNNGLVGFILHYIPKIRVLFDGFKLLKKNRKIATLILVIAVSLFVSDIGVITYYNRFLMIVLALAVKAVDFCKAEESDN